MQLGSGYAMGQRDKISTGHKTSKYYLCKSQNVSTSLSKDKYVVLGRGACIIDKCLENWLSGVCHTLQNRSTTHASQREPSLGDMTKLLGSRSALQRKIVKSSWALTLVLYSNAKYCDWNKKSLKPMHYLYLWSCPSCWYYPSSCLVSERNWVCLENRIYSCRVE